MTSRQFRKRDVVLTVILLSVGATGPQLAALDQVTDGGWSWRWVAGSALGAAAMVTLGALLGVRLARASMRKYGLELLTPKGPSSGFGLIATAVGAPLAPVVVAAGVGWLFGLAAFLWLFLGIFVPLARLRLRRQEAENDRLKADNE
ncbi:MAG: hypothetical protein QM714_14535 [Nocardioides sp.]|uniref:hypothetical protein n=1 Tax=Nocardioides sp. TaxID=35761 RepID=UPI0039E6F9A9